MTFRSWNYGSNMRWENPEIRAHLVSGHLTGYPWSEDTFVFLNITFGRIWVKGSPIWRLFLLPFLWRHNPLSSSDSVLECVSLHVSSLSYKCYSLFLQDRYIFWGGILITVAIMALCIWYLLWLDTREQFFQTELIQLLFICIAIFSILCVHLCNDHGHMVHSCGIALQRMRRNYWRQFVHCEWRSTRVLLYRMLPFFAQREKPKFKCNVLYRKVSSPKLDCSDRMCNLLARVSIQRRSSRPQKLVFFHLLFNSCGPLKHKLVLCNFGQKT